MKIEDYGILMENCGITVHNGIVRFTPYYLRDKAKIDKIKQDNGLDNLSFSQFKNLISENNDKYKHVRAIKLKKYNSMDTKEVAELPLSEKVQYLELLFPRHQTLEELMQLCSKNEENIRACLFNIEFPKSFIIEEKKKAQRYTMLVINSKNIMNNIQNWSDISLDEKKSTVIESAKIFEYVYGIKTEVEFTTESKERERMNKQGYLANAHINAAYYKNGKIYFNEDRLAKSDNLFAVSVLLHEGTHYRQDMETFQDDVVDRLLKSYSKSAQVYEDKTYSPESLRYKDLYSMQPKEIHAHMVQEYMENEFMEKTGIQKTQAKVDRKVENIHNKCFTMARLALYKSVKEAIK